MTELPVPAADPAGQAAADPAVPDPWRPDALGEEYQVRAIPLPAEADGSLTATLIRRRALHPDGRAVLYVHGFSDYFFQTELADYFAEQGIDFYAVDLRRYGRSLRPHHVPNFVTDLRDYFVELDAAMRIIRASGATRVAVNGHSTGGLIAALWAHELRHLRPADGAIDALLLNSPWFDIADPLPLRLLAKPLLGIVGRVRPQTIIPMAVSDGYGRSLHRDHHGEWDFDVTVKPLTGFPKRAGWLRAILRGQRRLHAGLQIQCPVLVMCSTRSIPRGQGGPLLRRTDGVLNVEQIARWSVALGPRVTICRIDGAVHDLVLSAGPVRKQVYEEMSTWLDLHFAPAPAPPPASQPAVPPGPAAPGASSPEAR
ncbi:MAG: alpha/beta hydrolase [Micromonosporaceae bacterium]